MQYPSTSNTTVKRILVVDDDEEVREILLEVLSYSNFQVSMLSDGKRIFEAIEAFKPDLILMDYIMPGDNGVLWCERIKHTPLTSSIPVILMSAYLGALNSINCCDSVLYKPFDLDILLQRVNDICCGVHTGHC